MKKKWGLLALGLAAFVAVAIPFGRAEGKRALEAQQRGLLDARAAVGGRVLHPLQSVYDPGGRLQCLVYPAGGNLLGLELCFDPSGGLVESVDRRGKERISSIRWAEKDAPTRIPPAQIAHAVQRVIPGDRLTGLLP